MINLCFLIFMVSGVFVDALYRVQKVNTKSSQSIDSSFSNQRNPTVHTSKNIKEQEITKINDRMGELRERYEELKFCSIGNKAMDSYDKYMIVNGINKKYVAKIEDNPV